MPFNKIDGAKLYRVETFGDNIAGEILHWLPVTAEGTADPSRSEMFVGKTSLFTPQGPIQLQWPIAATDLQSAIKDWILGLDATVEEMNSQAVRKRIESGIGAKIPPRKPGIINGG